MVIAAMQIEYENKHPTVSLVCNRLGMSVSTHARGIMNELADGGYLTKIESVHWNGRQAFVYQVNHEMLFRVCPDWYKEKAAIIGIQLTLPGVL